MSQDGARSDWWQASDGNWYPPAAGAPAVDAPLVQIGDITVTSHWVVTPQGTRPLAGTTWLVTDLSGSYRAIPTWAIVMAVIGFFFLLLGLLFLLVKEDRTDGWVQVTVSARGFSHSTSIPVRSQYAVADIHNRVNYARSVAAQAQSR
jgi:hypothetical protein